MDKLNIPFSRRGLLKGAAQVGLGGAMASLTDFSISLPQKNSVIVEENLREGSTDWQLTYVKSKNYRSKVIEGYCSHTSVEAGETLDIFVNTEQPSQVTIDVYRMGYYGGKGGRHMASLGPFSVEPQGTPEVGEHRLIECDWNTTAQLVIPEDWVSGVYLGKLSSKENRYQSYVIFVVRDQREADILVQTSDNTWQAYNKWPDNYSLYDSDPPQRPWSATTWISSDRPYGYYSQVVDQALSQGSGEYLLWEYPFTFWLEKNGYDVTYCSNIDRHTQQARLDRVKCYFSVGHDEYWSLEMYDSLQAAIAKGLNVGFLCGDSVTAVVPLNQKNKAGRPGRILRRTGMFGGIVDADREVFEKMSSGWGYDILNEKWEQHGPSQALMVGGRTTYPGNGSGDWTVSNEGHWIFEGTGMKNGDVIPGIVGWEYASDPPKNVPGFEILAEGEVMRADNSTSSYASTIYPGPKDNWVFNAATIYWCLGLAQPPGFNYPYSHLGRPHGPDERVEKIMHNFIQRALK